MNFSDLKLSRPLLNALEDLEYMHPTPIQEKAFPLILSGKDMIGVAQTGTGKTFAYLLPILRNLKYSEQRQPRVLIIVPTRELVMQVVEEAKSLTQYMSVRIAGVYGGTNINTQKQVVYDGVDILVATPGRLVDLALTKVLRLKNIKQFVIDEMDEMLNLGFRPQILNILDLLPERRQNILFSATTNDDIELIINDFFIEPVKIEIVKSGTPLELINQFAYDVPNYHTKVNLLNHILDTNKTITKGLVFVASKKLADRLFETLNTIYPEQIGVIHSNKAQNLRFRTLDAFEDGTYRILIATEIIARGMDIREVSHVINFDLPNNAANYIHRIGRTGRAEAKGVAISFINEVEKMYQDEIEDLMNKNIKMLDFPEEVEVSNIFTDEELPSFHQKNYLPQHKQQEGGGAFHDKKEKNTKVNLGGSYRRIIKAKYKKPKKRSGKKK
ncbi:MAG: DEAD/DEAH box helicase [Flavobacteriales bacterium]|nr:DEAD/DEAH box helicase [Flavobacteriales bacterium]